MGKPSAAWCRALSIATVAAMVAGAIVTDVLLGACGVSPTEPSVPVALTIAISSAGVSPANYTGPRVRLEFVNQDGEVHEIRSNPHPNHTDCPELNVGHIMPGQRVAILDPFEVGRTCGYHDDTRPEDARFNGTIMVR